MTDTHEATSGRNALGTLLRSARRMHPDDLPEAVASALEQVGARDVEILLIDLNQRELRGFGGRDTVHDVDDSPAGEAFRTEQPVVSQDGDRLRIFLPVADTMRVGVLAVTAESVDHDTLEALQEIAALTGELIATRGAYGDGIALTRRSKHTSLAAEMRWALLPPTRFLSDSVSLSGALEPAYDIAGDAFDYALNGKFLEFGILDAVGHGLEASRMASVAATSYRHSRREKLGLSASVLALDEVVADQFGDSRFVTAQLGSLNLTTGRLRLVSAGHPFPLHLRHGSEARELECAPYLPAGLGRGAPSTGEELDVTLEPGDSVLFYSDGVTEARSPDGEFFGPERLARRFTELMKKDLPLAEVTRALMGDVLGHQKTHLHDDATLLLVQWLQPRR
ncbi:MAG: GAF domain-containing SpoIIE family protein phosphatase [Acidimicrobiia bacterium]